MNEYGTPLPLSFRAGLLQRIMPVLRAGECCSLIGASGTGKSNLMRFIQRLDIQDHYWDGDTLWVVPIDSHSLVRSEHSAEYAVAELMIHRLIRAAEHRGLPTTFVAELDRLHTTLVAQPSTLLAMRYLERICAHLIENHNLRLVFTFDQFEDIWKTLDPRIFLNLRHLRDEFKYRLLYLVITRERLESARRRAHDDLEVVESFWELFSTHVYGLGMYNTEDAIEMVARIGRRRDMPVESALEQIALVASGGHPGLLRAIVWTLLGKQALPVNVEGLIAINAVATECSKLWGDLLPEEQRLVRLVALKRPLQPPDDEALAELRLKEIVIGDPVTLFSPMFAAYVRALEESDGMAGVVVHSTTRLVLVDGSPLDEKLSPLEFKLLEYLARHAGKVCTREAILSELYGDQMYNKNDDRIDALLRRLRVALRDEPGNPLIMTVRGVGVRLMRGRLHSDE